MNTRLTYLALIFALLLCTSGAGPATTHPLGQEDLPGPLSSTSTAQPRGVGLLPAGANLVVIPVKGLIYGYTLESLKSRVDRAVQGGASLIVIELDTPGGLVQSALKISRFLKTVPVRTVAWVNNEAFSAGIMIASACGQIVMAPASSTGDCAPIVPGQNLAPTERAKALSPILEEFRDSAQANNYDFALFHAMCVLGVEVYQIKNPTTGRTRLVNQADYKVMVVGAPPEGGWLSRVLPDTGGLVGASKAVGVGEATVTVATEADRGKWELVQKVHDGKTLLTLNQTRAFDVGLAINDSQVDPIRSKQELRQYLGATSVTTINPNPIAQVAYWMTKPWVRAILVVVFLLGAYLEMQVPGIGVAGIAALAALSMLIGAPFLVGLAQAWHVILFIVGVLLLLGEIFVVPGFGVLGIGGIVCMFTGLVLMVVPTTGQGPLPLPASEMTELLQQSVLATLIGIVVSGIALFYLIKHFGNLPVLGRLVLKATSPTAAGSAIGVGQPVSGDEVIGHGQIEIGSAGTTQTELRPTGRANLGADLIDVMSRGEWIEPGRPVRVVEVHGNRIVVEEIVTDTDPN